MRVFTAEHRAKLSAAKAGKPGPWLGKKRGVRSAAQIEKHRQAVTGRPKPQGFGDRLRVERSGFRHTLDGIARIKAALARPEIKEKLRLGPLGKPCRLRPRQHHYAGRVFRSGYEVRVARALDALGVSWDYEPKRFDFGTFTYCPDFYLPESGAFWEVKGYFRDKCREKVRRFRSEHPDIPLVLITKHCLAVLEAAARRVV